jgi:S-formylglutathione hydrolase FrmB
VAKIYPVKRVLGALVALSLGVFLAPATQAATSSRAAFRSAAGLHVLSVKEYDARDYNISVSTSALGRAVNIRLLLPTGYSPQRRYPVLYLFHGTSGAASDWVVQGQAERLTAGLPLIVVMPDAGFDDDGGGWCTNWVDTTTKLGPSQWETFHIAQLIPWVDANLSTVPNRGGRAVAGLSQGGFCSTTYAARYPDLFASVGSFSGAPDIDYNPVVAAGATGVIDATAAGLDGVEPQAMFGSRATDEINWQGHDPADLIQNLWPVSVWLYTANGVPGPYDHPYPNPGAMGIEGLVGSSTDSFDQRAHQVGLPVHFDDYVYGTHSWSYWSRDLSWYLSPLMKTFAHPSAAPKTITYQSVAQSWSHWGWTVSWKRSAAQDWNALIGAGPSGFTLAGVGTATVVTPPFYRPGAALRVNGVTVHADRRGRLHLTVAVGGSSSPAVVGEPGVIDLGGAKMVTIHPS